MKIALITDTHAGARNDNLVIDDYFRKFYDEIFFPYIDQHQIKTVIHLGDAFDRRKFINFNILERVKNYFFNPVRDRGIDFHLIAGNHDVYYKNINDLNSPELLLTEYGFHLYHKPETVNFGGCKICIMPWIASGNAKESFEYLAKTDAHVLFGHLEISGFEMHRGSVSTHGFDKGLFKKFDLVASGHFHTKSRNNNIIYLGAPYEMTWADWNDPKGFHVFDTETRELEFIQNPFTIFKKLYYDDSGKELEQLLEELPDLKDTYVKVVVINKTNPYWYDIFVDKIEKMNPVQMQLLENAVYLGEDDENLLEEIEDTQSLLKKYCSQVESSVNKKSLEAFMLKLYKEALETED